MWSAGLGNWLGMGVSSLGFVMDLVLSQVWVVSNEGLIIGFVMGQV